MIAKVAAFSVALYGSITLHLVEYYFALGGSISLHWVADLIAFGNSLVGHWQQRHRVQTEELVH
jgi:hypothetical protein